MPDNTDDNGIIFKTCWRSPKYPVIIMAPDRLWATKSLNGLARVCLGSPTDDAGQQIFIIDATGDEFIYVSKSYAVVPNIIHKMWTKKRMIDLYNQSVNARETGIKYSERSLGNKHIARITADLCALIEKSTDF